MNNNNQGSFTQTSAGGTAQPQSNGSGTGNSKMLIYIVAAVVIIIAVIVVVILFSSIGSSLSGVTTIIQNQSLNATPVYMSPAQAQALLGPQVSNYYASDMFNPDSPINMTDVEYAVPSTYGNVTSAWLSSGSVDNSTYNASLQFYEFKTQNASGMAQLLSSALSYGLNITPTVVTPGTYNGLNYSYSLYQNSSYSFQMVYGWKGNNVGILVLESAPPYVVNETKFIGLEENDTP